MPADRPIGFRRFSDGTTRPVFLDHDGRQYIFNDGRPVHGVWLDQRRQAPADAVDPVPIIRDARRQ
jgi:hypothetical protein